jgi:hypothetical protein
MAEPKSLGISLDSPDVYREAAERCRARFREWASGHPIEGWIRAAERVAATLVAGRLPDGTDLPKYVESDFIPASRLVRLAWGLEHLEHVGGAVKRELKQMIRDRDHLYHSEYVIHLAVRLSNNGQREVEVVPTAGGTPDLAVPSEKFCIECSTRETSSTRQSLKEAFEHADAKFKIYLADKSDWLGVVAVDLGLCGSPSFPEIGKIGPSLRELSADLDTNFELFPRVSVAIVGWSAAELEQGTSSGDSAQLYAQSVIAVRYAKADVRRLVALDSTFRPWPQDPVRVVNRQKVR